MNSNHGNNCCSQSATRKRIVQTRLKYAPVTSGALDANYKIYHPAFFLTSSIFYLISYHSYHSYRNERSILLFLSLMMFQILSNEAKTAANELSLQSNPKCSE